MTTIMNAPLAIRIALVAMALALFAVLLINPMKARAALILRFTAPVATSTPAVRTSGMLRGVPMVHTER